MYHAASLTVDTALAYGSIGAMRLLLDWIRRRYWVGRATAAAYNDDMMVVVLFEQPQLEDLLLLC